VFARNVVGKKPKILRPKSAKKSVIYKKSKTKNEDKSIDDSCLNDNPEIENFENLLAKFKKSRRKILKDFSRYNWDSANSESQSQTLRKYYSMKSQEYKENPEKCSNFLNFCKTQFSKILKKTSVISYEVFTYFQRETQKLEEEKKKPLVEEIQKLNKWITDFKNDVDSLGYQQRATEVWQRHSENQQK
jgi:hypothetical protein